MERSFGSSLMETCRGGTSNSSWKAETTMRVGGRDFWEMLSLRLPWWPLEARQHLHCRAWLHILRTLVVLCCGGWADVMEHRENLSSIYSSFPKAWYQTRIYSSELPFHLWGPCQTISLQYLETRVCYMDPIDAIHWVGKDIATKIIPRRVGILVHYVYVFQIISETKQWSTKS